MPIKFRIQNNSQQADGSSNNDIIKLNCSLRVCFVTSIQRRRRRPAND